MKKVEFLNANFGKSIGWIKMISSNFVNIPMDMLHANFQSSTIVRLGGDVFLNFLKISKKWKIRNALTHLFKEIF